MANENRLDLEDVMDQIKLMCQTNLNTEIAAVEAAKVAKGKGLAGGLTPVDPDNGYFIQSWSQGILNIDPAVFIEADNPQQQDAGLSAGKIHKVAVYFILTDSGQSNDITSRILRYSKALELVFENAYFEGCGKFKVESILPVSFPRDTDSSEQIKIGGITLTVPLG